MRIDSLRIRILYECDHDIDRIVSKRYKRAADGIEE